MDKLQYLNSINKIKIYDVNSPEFAPYGCIVQGVDFSEALAYLRDSLPPVEGTKYIASLPDVEAMACTKSLSDLYFGCIDIEMGVCYGANNSLNALEYHKCNEINLSLEGCVLLLGLLSDLKDGRMDSSVVKAFYVPAGCAVELNQATLHFAPCKVEEQGFRTLVALPRGTNNPLPEGREKGTGEAALLATINKWILPHESNATWLGRGYPACIFGENIEIRWNEG